MKFINLLRVSSIKFAKGLFAVYFILVVSSLVVQSCKKTDKITDDKAAKNFLTALQKNRKAIGEVSVQVVNNNGLYGSYGNIQNANSDIRTVNTSTDPMGKEQVAYITFDDMPINPDYSYNIYGMATLVNNYSGVVTYQPSDNSVQFTIPLEEVNNNLLPLIPEAKAYLNARGLTNADIDLMIQEEGGQETDLVAFAAVLAQYEGSDVSASNFSNIFFNSAYAKRSVGTCAMVALGVDAIWALSGSNASQWSKKAIKQAFGAVAKRALGPIGVAIAVATFGLCLGDWLP